ncbi:DEAD/DEAH box helicase [Magnetofaba australis]|uniref:Putative superfamily II DNA/RNA helicase n=1 Tax=Magnetofaba australis IT-1 TaxID=1434232 RepID=A0A1Y2K431_9PROT|nr:DEAD/DEAH box helicase [Magnetofaba australis]OSM04165.1 putative superfamily II DNA/RNA helicase [Magnetofaba australis IT-1]
MELRGYQQEAIDALFAWWAERRGENPVLVLPTGAGKTVIFSALIQRLVSDYPGTRILVLAHRKELIAQAEAKLLTVWPEAPVGVLAASLGRREMAPVTIASRDTIAGIVEQVGWFDLVFVDEAHNIAPGENTRYRKIINALKQRNPNLHVIGFSATPFRTGQGYIYGDEEKHLFQGVAYEARIKRLIDEGWLCPVTARAVSDDSVADTSAVKTTAGDFNQGQLEQVVSDNALINAAVTEWERLAYQHGRRSSVFFCVSVLHAHLVSDALSHMGHDVPVVSGTTPQEERDEILEKFDAGDLIGIANVGVLTEGWDSPRLDCICLLRPTKSLGLYMQMVGRGLRLFPGKENCLVLDFGECIERFGPIDIARPANKRREEDPRTKTCPVCQTIHGYLKRKCPCGNRFQEEPAKECEKCGEPNPIAAKLCMACAAPFVTHGKRARNGGILSGEPAPQRYEVEGVTCSVRHSKTSGRPYLQIRYHHDLTTAFTQNLMLGYPGFAGERAAAQWRNLSYSGSPIPEHPQQALSRCADDLKPVISVVVDMNSRWKEVLEIEFEEVMS